MSDYDPRDKVCQSTFVSHISNWKTSRPRKLWEPASNTGVMPIGTNWRSALTPDAHTYKDTSTPKRNADSVGSPEDSTLTMLKPAETLKPLGTTRGRKLHGYKVLGKTELCPHAEMLREIPNALTRKSLVRVLNGQLKKVLSTYRNILASSKERNCILSMRNIQTASQCLTIIGSLAHRELVRPAHLAR